MWASEEEKTTDEIIKEKRKKFTNFAYPLVLSLLKAHGYKRVGYNSGLLAEFDKTTVYDLYMENNFEMLAKYYSLGIKKGEADV